MSEYQQFLAEQSAKLLGDILNGALAASKEVNPKDCADLAVLSAKALYERLSVEGAA